MKKNAMRKNLRQSILNSLGRYIAIVLIIALGAGIFVGLLMTKADMVATGQKYMADQKMFDLRLMSSYGWGSQQLDAIAALPEVETAEGIIYLDMIASIQGIKDDSVFRFYAIPEQMNRITLQGGRMPESPDECLIDGYVYGDRVLGTTVRISEINEQQNLDCVSYRTYTVVGYVSSPLYMDLNRGTTTVGSGSLETFIYLPRESFDIDYYPEIHVTIPGRHDVYTDAYHDAMEDAAQRLEPLLLPMAEQRFETVRAEAVQAYSEGMLEYYKGMKEFHEAEAEVMQQLDEAHQELLDAQEELAAAERKITQGEAQLRQGKQALIDAQKELDAGKAQFEEQLGLIYEPLQATMAELRSERAAIQQKVDSLESRIISINDQLSGLGYSSSDIQKRITLRMELASAQTELSAQRQALTAVDVSIQTIQPLEAEFVAMENEIIAGQKQIDEGWATIRASEKRLKDGRTELEDGRKELEQGWEEYERGKTEAQRELDEAREKLAEGKAELADALKQIQDMKKPSLYILDRNSNIGYGSLDSASDIVQGVARVIPAFFLLVASLVCITTMTRMIDEERIQIGTLKALGYSNGAIISKYLIYAGSGAVVGCGLGVLAGSLIFPAILWEAYRVMLCIPGQIILKINWLLCGIVVATYTLLMLTVTWYCCRKALDEQPAELIRPKSPDPGKKLLIERLRIWNRVSFLNKVTLRNIFRYRQRLAMMIVGIGGCTALLLTGFGLRDSISNVVNYQFSEVTVYDLQVYFEEGLTEADMDRFLEEMEDAGENVLFYHQQSVELTADERTKELYLMASDERIMDFVDYHYGKKSLQMPGLNEALLSVGTAEALGIEVGDEIVLRNSDMEVLHLRVSGIYENHVYNYLLVIPQTLQAQWGEYPASQMALVQVSDRVDPHALSADISGIRGVMNVTVSEDLAFMVENMMKALDMVIWVVVFCAGLLATIVLYNLTNININERIREIATIKVLGFRAGETGAYVFKENLTLTVAGSLIGLGLGYGLLVFVMSQIKIDMVWFKVMIMPVSYLLSFVLTLVAACVVDYIFYFKLDKINMAEALKSVE